MMKWAVYWDNDEIHCDFYPDRDKAVAKVAVLMAQCEQTAADNEQMEYWDITLLEVRGDVIESPNGLKLLQYPAGRGGE